MISDDLINELMRSTRTNSKCTKSTAAQKYPLTNISYDEETELIFVEVALAGFAKEDINMKIEDGKLYISAGFTNDESDTVKYMQRDIATRDFERVIALDDRYANGTTSASYDDGLLTISIEPSETYSNIIEIQ